MCNLVRLTSEWNKELLISIMSASNTQRGQGTQSDTQNTLGAVNLRDLLGFGAGRDSRQGGLGRFGGPSTPALVPGNAEDAELSPGRG